MLKAGLVTLALLAGFILATFGIVTVGWAEQPWPTLTSFAWFACYLFLLGAITHAIAHWRRLSHPAAALIVAALVAAAAGEWLTLLFVPLFVLSSMATGRLAARRCAAADASDDLLLDFLLGAGLYATLIGLMAHLPLAYPAVYAALLSAPLLARPGLAPELARAMLDALRAWEAPKRGSQQLLPLALCALALVHFFVAFFPETGHDALAMHLFLPTYMESRLAWSFDPQLYAWALMPMLGDWLYALLYVLAGETGARLVNVCFILALAVFVQRFARWAGATRQSAAWAVALYLSMPLTFGESSSLFIDSIWASCLLAAAWWMLQANADNQRQVLLLGGIFMGFALQAKLGTTTFVPLLLLCIAHAARRAPGLLRGARICRFLLPFACFGYIPYLTAWLISGNPVFPFFNGIFESPYYPPSNFASAFPGFLSWDLPYLLTFTSNRFMDGTVGTPGFQWPMLLPAAVLLALFARNGRALLLLAGGIGTIVLTFSAQSYMRYVFPVLPPLIGVLALLLEQQGTLPQRLALLAAGICVAANLAFFPASTWGYRSLPPRAVFSEKGRAEYLAGIVPSRNLVPAINALNPEGLPVAFLADTPVVAGVRSDVLFSSWYNQRFLGALQEAGGDTDAIARVLRGYGAQLVVLDENMAFTDFKKRVHLIGEPLAQSGNFSLLRVVPEYRFGEELLQNGALDGGAAGWELGDGAYYDAAEDALVVSVASPATQYVAVPARREFRLAVDASCIDAGVLGRLQINWHGTSGEFIAASIRTFVCDADATAHELLAQAPAGAAGAVVFLTSHEERPLRIHAASLR